MPDRLEPLALRAERLVESARRLGDLAQPRRVEARLDELSARIADEARPALRIGHGDQLAGGRADAHGVDADALLRDLARGRDGAALEILAVGEHDQALLVPLLGGERSAASRSALARSVPAVRDDARIERLQRLEEGVVVERERGLEERGARERDQADAVVLEPADQVDDRELRALEAIRSRVLGQHAARHVDGEQHVDAAAVLLLPVEAELGAGERREDAGEAGGQQQRRACRCAARVETLGGEGIEQMRADEAPRASRRRRAAIRASRIRTTIAATPARATRAGRR